MVASAQAAQALVEDARRIADEVEILSGQLYRIGALSAIRQFMELHSEGNACFDMLDAAKNLRSFAGILSVIAATPYRPPAKPSNNGHCPRLPILAPQITP